METNFEIRSRDSALTVREYEKLPRHPLSIILDNLRSAFNVGAVFRLCDTLRAQELLLCGYTASPPNAKLEKTSVGTTDTVPWKKFGRTADAVAYARRKGCTIWAAETTSHSRVYTELPVPPRVAVVLGNEALGIGRDIVGLCDDVVEIPVFGFKNSLNVAASCAVIGYRIVMEMEHTGWVRSGS